MTNLIQGFLLVLQVLVYSRRKHTINKEEIRDCEHPLVAYLPSLFHNPIRPELSPCLSRAEVTLPVSGIGYLQQSSKVWLVNQLTAIIHFVVLEILTCDQRLSARCIRFHHQALAMMI